MAMMTDMMSSEEACLPLELLPPERAELAIFLKGHAEHLLELVVVEVLLLACRVHAGRELVLELLVLEHVLVRIEVLVLLELCNGLRL